MRDLVCLALLFSCAAPSAAIDPESSDSAPDSAYPTIRLSMGEAPRQVRTFRNNDEELVELDIVQSLYIVTFANAGSGAIEFKPIITYTEVNIPKLDLPDQKYVRCGDRSWMPRMQVHQDWDPGCEPLVVAAGDSIAMTFAHPVPDYLPSVHDIEVEVRLQTPPRCDPNRPGHLTSFVAFRDTVSVWF